jgi:hypothetical protein
MKYMLRVILFTVGGFMLVLFALAFFSFSPSTTRATAAPDPATRTTSHLGDTVLVGGKLPWICGSSKAATMKRRNGPAFTTVRK